MSSEEIKKSAFKAFAQVQQTFAEAEEKAKQEAGTPRVERFRTGEDGEYIIRVLPLAPNFDENGNILPMERKGYEYPIRQQFLTIEAQGKKGKAKKLMFPVIRTTDKEIGYSVDLIDTYLKIAKEMYGDDDELMELINGSSYNGGLKWQYSHAVMVIDVSSDKERAKGPQLWQCSHGQYKDLDAARLRLWKEELEDDENAGCPVCSIPDAYPVKIIRKTAGKTEYTIEIGRKRTALKEEEIDKLLDLPRIPELIYRYTRYQLEATVVALQQYDEKHDMEVCKESDFLEAVEKLKGELPADDTSHFDLADAASKDGGKEEVTVNSLWAEYDAIADQGLGEKSDEYQELREKIRQFIEDNELDVRISRSKNNQVLLEEVEEAFESASKKQTGDKAAGGRKPVDEDDEQTDGEPDNRSGDDADEEEEAVEERPRRRARPGSGEDRDGETAAHSTKAAEAATSGTAQAEPAAEPQGTDGGDDGEAAGEEAPRRRLRSRRLR